jgi:sporulation protein YlmC with PRC-barrel domain
MSDHILSKTQKCVAASSGRFLDDGGINYSYIDGAEDYFIIRRTAAVATATPFVNFSIDSWDVRDQNVVGTNYSYIDAFTSSTGFPNSWTWICRLGGNVHNSGTPIEGQNYFTPSARAIKFCFRSNYGSNYQFSGWRINWDSAVASVGADISTGEVASVYDDILDIKENCLDKIYTDTSFGTELFKNSYFDDKDPAQTRWGYIPPGQFNNGFGEEPYSITMVNYNTVQFNLNRAADAQAQFSVMATDQRFIGQLGEVIFDPDKER